MTTPLELTEMSERLIAAPFARPVIERGFGSRVVDTEGVEYLDFSSGPGVLALGHCDPEVMEAAAAQLHVLTQSPGKFLNARLLEFVDALAQVTPPSINGFFFANSGAEAVDGAIKLALKHASRQGRGGFGIITLDYGFHGRTSLPLSLTTMPDRKFGFGPYATFPGVVSAESPYAYRMGTSPEESAARSLDSIRRAIEIRAPGEIAAFIAEPILATGGILVPPPGYWQSVVELCRSHGIVVIFDEVFTGFGRTGRMFAAEHWDVVPDIMTMGKAIGGGFPLACFAATSETMSAMHPGDHYTTFGANNVVAFAAGLATLRALKERGTVAAALEKGQYLLERLHTLSETHQLIGDVRGKGLLVGVEIVANQESREADEHLIHQVVEELLARRILVLTSGYRHCTIRLTPPLTVSTDEIDELVHALDGALTAVETSRP